MQNATTFRASGQRAPNISFGEGGTCRVTGSVTVNAADNNCQYFFKVQAIGAATLSTGSVDVNNTGATWQGVALSDHTEIYGTFTSIQLVSGTVLAFKSDSDAATVVK
jgi:hypothetical protein